MIRLAISVEGATEREFVSRTLAPHLETMAIFTTPVVLGGPPNLDRIGAELKRLLPSFDWVSTLYDYYGFNRRGTLGPDKLRNAIVAAAHESERDRLIPYVQVYEFEALVFSDPVTVARLLRLPSLEEALTRVLADCGEPERIDDGYDTCPSRRLKILYPGWDKVLHGPQAIDAIGLPALQERCPRFGAWIESLERLGQSASSGD